MLKWAKTIATRLRWRVSLGASAAALLVAAAIAGGFGNGTQPARGAQDPATGGSVQGSPITDDQAVGAARQLAAQNGEPAPSGVELVHSTHGRALGQIDPGEQTNADDARDVVVVELHGHFTATLVPHPAASDPPSGSVMTVVLDAATGQLLDLGIVNAAPSLAPLGAVREMAG